MSYHPTLCACACMECSSDYDHCITLPFLPHALLHGSNSMNPVSKLYHPTPCACACMQCSHLCDHCGTLPFLPRALLHGFNQSVSNITLLLVHVPAWNVAISMIAVVLYPFFYLHCYMDPTLMNPGSELSPYSLCMCLHGV